METSPETNNDLAAIRTPIGLQNPKNHCYVNSVLQILQRILLSYHDNVDVKDNVQGSLVNSFIIACNEDRNLAKFKEKLSNFDSYFNGMIQRDAYECMLKLLDIFHTGTKKLVIEVADGMLEEDDYSMSLTKTLFSFNMRKELCCNICNASDIQYIQAQNLNLYPSMGDDVQRLFKNSMTSYLTKRCSSCHTNTRHKETSKIIQPPKFMIFVINRYPSVQGGN